MKHLKTAVVAGVTFQGESVTVARAKGEATVAAFVREAIEGPALYHVHAATVLIWPDIEGWSYRVLGMDNDRDGTIAAQCSMNGTRDSAILDAIYAAAQRQWSAETVTDDAGFFGLAFRSAPCGFEAPRKASERKVADLVTWAGWQRRWLAAHRAGANRNEAYNVADMTRTPEDAAAMVRSWAEKIAA